ncbi:MAG: TSUP family transporter [Propionibacteriaceae bacterium]|jgi:uncharacterized membrane protein YfcA|nr:TSUP family transporter [Propionibacteriaceae bacterium]
MIDQLPLLTVVLLIVAAGAAGWIDAVVGGGGVIQLPALLIGLPADTPVPAVSGTNKLSSAAGTAAAAGSYLAKVKIDWPAAFVVTTAAFAGSAVGAQFVRFVPRIVFTPVVAVVVAAIGLYTWRRPAFGQTTRLRHSGAAQRAWSAGLGLAAGAWDGLVGPGTGVFFVMGYVLLLGYGLLPATVMAKLANLATNLAALLVLGIQGQVFWALGAAMALANVAGGATGARMALKRGHRFIRRVLLVAVVLVEVRLVYDTVRLAMG